MKPTYVVAIDPSVDNCGWAVFEKGKPIKYGIIHPKQKKDHYLIKAGEVAKSIFRIIDDLSEYEYPFDDIQLVTEIPQSFGNAGFLARESGAILKLSFLAGMIYNITPRTKALEPQQWKAQLPKCVIRARLSRIYPKLPLYKGKKNEYCVDCKREHPVHDLDHNIVDAIGICHAYIAGSV